MVHLAKQNVFTIPDIEYTLFFCLHTRYILCLKKGIPDIVDYNSKQDWQILIIFGTIIPHKTGH